MKSLLFHQPLLADAMYHHLQAACSKSGYKVVAVNKEEGTIEAEKRKVFGLKTILKVNVKEQENKSTKINVIVHKNEIEDNIAAQKVMTIISQSL
jgi:Zn-dependent M28 family amino/carboxypeptidase